MQLSRGLFNERALRSDNDRIARVSHHIQPSIVSFIWYIRNAFYSTMSNPNSIIIIRCAYSYPKRRHQTFQTAVPSPSSSASLVVRPLSEMQLDRLKLRLCCLCLWVLLGYHQAAGRQTLVMEYHHRPCFVFELVLPAPVHYGTFPVARPIEYCHHHDPLIDLADHSWYWLLQEERCNNLLSVWLKVKGYFWRKETYLLGAVCRYPMELTLFNRFFKAANAEDCGRSMRIPYMHLYKYGYFSGSSSWSRKSALLSVKMLTRDK